MGRTWCSLGTADAQTSALRKTVASRLGQAGTPAIHLNEVQSWTVFEEGCAYRRCAGFDEVGGWNGLRPSGSLTLAARRVLHVGAFFLGRKGLRGRVCIKEEMGFWRFAPGVVHGRDAYATLRIPPVT